MASNEVQVIITAIDKASPAILKVSNAFNNQFLSGLERGETSTKAFGKELLSAADKAGLSTVEIRKMAGATGLFTNEQLLAGQASANVAAKAQELSQAVKNGTMTTRDAGAAFNAYAQTQVLTTQKSFTLKDAIRGVSIAMVVGTGAVLAAKKAYEATIAPTVAYNKQIREMTQVTGLGAEEISRIVQVGDDWGISIEALRTSLGYMNKMGVTPSIENLADLADEYVNTTDKAAFAEKAAKLLGRGYQTLIPLLAKGGDELRAQTEAIDDNLIATEKSIAEARKYELALDALQDRWVGLTYTIGNVAIPVLTQALTPALQREVDLSRVLIQEVDGVRRAFIRQGNGLRDVTDMYNEAHSAAAKFAREDLIDIANNADLAASSLGDVTLALTKMTTAQLADDAIQELNKALKEGTITEQAYKEAMRGIGTEMLEMTDAQIDAQLALFEMKQALEEGGVSAVEFTNYAKSLDRTLRGLPHDVPITINTTSVQSAINKMHELERNMDDEYKTVYVNTVYTTSGAPRPERAVGGPVTAGQAYTVGERGAEMFVAPSNGYILSHTDTMNAMKGSGGRPGMVGSGSSLYIAEQNITILNGSDTDEINEAIIRANQMSLRTAGSLSYAG